MDERQRADRYIEKMHYLQDRVEERDRIEAEIEALQDELTEQWGEMGDYARNRVGLFGAER